MFCRFFYDTTGFANSVQLESLKLLVFQSQIVFRTHFSFVGTLLTVSGVDAIEFGVHKLRAIYRNKALQIL